MVGGGGARRVLNEQWLVMDKRKRIANKYSFRNLRPWRRRCFEDSSFLGKDVVLFRRVVSDVSTESVLRVQDQAIKEVSLDESATTLRTPGAAGQTKYHQISEQCSFKLRIDEKKFHILEPKDSLQCVEL